MYLIHYSSWSVCFNQCCLWHRFVWTLICIYIWIQLSLQPFFSVSVQKPPSTSSPPGCIWPCFWDGVVTTFGHMAYTDECSRSEPSQVVLEENTLLLLMVWLQILSTCRYRCQPASSNQQPTTWWGWGIFRIHWILERNNKALKMCNVPKQPKECRAHTTAHVNGRIYIMCTNKKWDKSFEPKGVIRPDITKVRLRHIVGSFSIMENI